jgi:hypothetical protein
MEGRLCFMGTNRSRHRRSITSHPSANEIDIPPQMIRISPFHVLLSKYTYQYYYSTWYFTASLFQKWLQDCPRKVLSLNFKVFWGSMPPVPQVTMYSRHTIVVSKNLCPTYFYCLFSALAWASSLVLIFHEPWNLINFVVWQFQKNEVMLYSRAIDLYSRPIKQLIYI